MLNKEDIADIRAKARSDFFGYDDPRLINYMKGALASQGKGEGMEM